MWGRFFNKFYDVKIKKFYSPTGYLRIMKKQTTMEKDICHSGRIYHWPLPEYKKSQPMYEKKTSNWVDYSQKKKCFTGQRSQMSNKYVKKHSHSFVNKVVLIKILRYHFFPFIFISWRLITLWYFSGFCHTLTWISHGFTCVPHPNSPLLPPFHPIPLGLPSAPALSTCLMHPTWAGDLFHPW